jgi:hypothetical protein
MLLEAKVHQKKHLGLKNSLQHLGILVLKL